VVRDGVVGVLDFQSDSVDGFDQETIDLLTLFSTQASIALENARLYSLERRRTEQLEAINAVARQTTAVLDLDELLTVVCRLILEWFPVDHVAVLLREDDETLLLKAHQGKLTPVMQQGARIPVTGVSARALNDSRAIVENDISKVEGYISGFAETRSEMCVPLIFFGERLGVLALESAKVAAFDETDVPPLESVADICAAAIQNAHHFRNVKDMAYIDGLTGIHNRRFFEQRMAEEVERAERFAASMSLIMVDIDNFKRLNDEFGHLLGDEVLRGVSGILKEQLRKIDVLCRYGGEEFVVILAETSAPIATAVAEKLRRLVEGHHFPGVPRPVSISAGVAEYPLHGKNRDELVAAADAAMYMAKQAGRNRVCTVEGARSAGQL
jgi:diguanylate cyclase (GGDEF)-like protein